MDYLERWRIIKPIDEGGQGKVYRVCRLDTKLEEDCVKALQAITGISSTEERRKNLHNFIRLLSELLQLEDPANQGALKVLHSLQHSVDVEKAQERIRHEIDSMSQNLHPNLLKILDVDPDYEWYVSKFYEKGTLEKHGDLFKEDFVKCLKAIRPLVEGVAKLHEAKYVHRDIKPKNIFVGLNDELVLGDFGLIYFEDAGHERVSETYENVGSRDWMPGWAMAMRLEEIKPTFDVFALGKILWSMVSGKTVLPLWYFSKPKFNVEVLFPNSWGIKYANLLFEKCIVEDEGDCIQDAGVLLAEIDEVLGKIEKGVQMVSSKQKEDIGKNGVVWEKPFYWNISKGQKDGPYCQRCYDKDEILMHLKDHRNGIWSCPECNTTYDDGSYHEPVVRGPTIV